MEYYVKLAIITILKINSKILKQLRDLKKHYWDLPGGTVVKNLPTNAGDTGSSPGPGRSHMPHRMTKKKRNVMRDWGS